ncbi:SDR family NAD(P)-dependent oxidoreductase [Cohaesibacter sp. CAU 1516]|uniref:type I polyketide synthase n=1 Tax=Cohaesibacter sp. CAU 1516 TaxID=2576038 RepID=UPI0010FE5771|nr:type I polyketide synthase [Cohaesibacter sp. CAU 1516]TLP42390.1 SDR family NAD(P)-dependent oxidoreductase [Cohaesibacter sp. CAU 1516]
MPIKTAEVIGRACRLPSANSVADFWALLRQGRCSVTEIGDDRFSVFRYLHPARGQPGKAYTFRAGVLDDVWGFDPVVFALSPREAMQMDPQQRLLLMLVWEALEEAGLPPSEIAGQNIGVFVGNSGSDHSNRFFFDPANSDSFMMTGNTMSLVSNRISYIFDLHGPSFTVDTACSSSLVAMDLAMKRLQSGEIDTAIVAGVNMLLSPFPFVGFSAASMLSPEGLCRPFDENANGYVRAEGAVALVLQRSDVHDAQTQKSFGRIVASGINSDGRTSGVALPSMEFQAELLQQVYQSAGISPDQLAFIEAHGTGTRVGDPTEAYALGKVLAKGRKTPLPIGSVKSNIGHLEPASGIASILKALLALEHNVLPASLHIKTPNPDIPFDDLNLALNREETMIEKSEDLLYAGINNFGFGGTNAHLLVSQADPNQIKAPRTAALVAKTRRKKRADDERDTNDQLMILSAKTADSLKVLAKASADRIAREVHSSLGDWSNAYAWHRERMDERLVIAAKSKQDLTDKLELFVKGERNPAILTGMVAKPDADPVFVFSGNGSQFVGMGQAAYRDNAAFRSTFDQVDHLFAAHADWSLKERLFAETLGEDLKLTSIAQPLLFALQVALTSALKELGLKPAGVLGHSVGEVAAAWAAGALSLPDAVAVIYLRSYHQEAVRGFGQMAVIKLSQSEVAKHLAAEGHTEIEISAINTPRSLTLSGPSEALQSFMRYARKNRLSGLLLDIDYPFHSRQIDPIKNGLIKDLSGIKPHKSSIPFYSSVTGALIEGEDITGDYWWHNVREPVSFCDAVSLALAEGHRSFIEIGPRPILKSYIAEIAREKGVTATAIESLTQAEADHVDPVLIAAGRALAVGIEPDPIKLFGDKKGLSFPLPSYPWQLKPFKLEASSDAFEVFSPSIPAHPLLGQQLRPGDLIWDSELDTRLIPYLADHKVDGKVILPGAAFAEMALAAARQALETDLVELRDFDLMKALPLAEDQSVSVRTRIDLESNNVEILSRKRLVDEEWQRHIKARIARIPGDAMVETADHDLTAPAAAAPLPEAEIEALYAVSRDFGLDFGPAFRRVSHFLRFEDSHIDLLLTERSPSIVAREKQAAPYGLHPLDLDGCFHALNSLYEELDDGAEKMAFIPVRFGRLRLLQTEKPVRSARILVLRSNNRGIQADIDLFGEDGTLIATLRDARFRASALVQRQDINRLTYGYRTVKTTYDSERQPSAALDLMAFRTALQKNGADDWTQTEERHLILQAASRQVAYDCLKALIGTDTDLTPDKLPALQSDPALSGEEAASDLKRRRSQRDTLFWSLVTICIESGMAEQGEDGVKLASSVSMPPASQVLELLLMEDPAWSGEVILLNHAEARLMRILSGEAKAGDLAEGIRDLYSNDLLDQHFSASPMARAHLEQLSKAFDLLLQQWPEGRPLRVLQLGTAGGQLTKSLLPRIEQLNGQWVSIDSNKLVVDRLGIQFAQSPHFKALTLEAALADLRSLGSFDVILTANNMQMMNDAASILPHLPTLLADHGLMLATLTDGSVFQDICFGMASRWFDGSLDPTYPVASHGTADNWRGWISEAGLASVELLPFEGAGEATGLTGSYWLLATAPLSEPASETAGKPKGAAFEDTALARPQTIVLTDASDKAEKLFATLLSDQLAASGQQADTQSLPCKGDVSDKVAWQTLLATIMSKSETGSVDLIFLAGAFVAETEPFAAMAKRLHWLRQLLVGLPDKAVRLWMLAPDGYHDGTDGAVNPAQTGVWAFARAAGNEYSHLDIRLVDLNGSLAVTDQVAGLTQLLAMPGEERELRLEADGLSLLRIARGPKLSAQRGRKQSDEKAACKLTHPRTGSLDRLKWVPVDRLPPKAGEVEIEVAASGLNFRDLMWAQGLLPEEALEDGFAGPTLGFECSGRVIRVGEGIKRLKVGDAVMALAPACFASHVTVAEVAVSRLPEAMDLKAAAAMPVAFLTSYYALHHLARLEEGEWVLIHGAAGAVGLAAVQIAKWRGARIIATAGNDEKRDFLRLLGVDHVLDTRSLDFVDQVRAITRKADGPGREGVDVVLNSLFGEAMERSIELVRPFGRFLELGKRDFYGNSKIGLRPFRRNISYFGIDADQLLNHQPALSSRLFGELEALFESSDFTLLPYRLFDSSDIVDAFRLMQRSGHIGKILVKAPEPTLQGQGASPFKIDADGHHLIIGGLGGFGLETADWLLDKGARSIILTSRSAKVSDEAQALLAKAEALGASLKVAACDATSETALASLLDDLRQSAPLRGVIHAAMVLDDALIANLDDGRIDAVLAPKVVGGAHIDRLTREDALDYFWLYSSVSVLMGNPGQSAYVAANAYLDGLAAKRRSEGLPALSIGWGAITDKGILAREEKTAEILARATGGMEFKARRALDGLAELLATYGVVMPASLTLAPMDWSYAKNNLALLKHPAYHLLAREAEQSSNRDRQSIDIATLIEGLDDIAARDTIAKLLAGEVANIFRMPVEEIQLNRSLSDIGMDSLMGMELRSAAQQKLDIEIPMGAISDGTTIEDIAASIVQRVRKGTNSELSSAQSALLQQHVGKDADVAKVAGDLAPLRKAP